MLPGSLAAHMKEGRADQPGPVTSYYFPITFGALDSGSGTGVRHFVMYWPHAARIVAVFWRASAADSATILFQRSDDHTAQMAPTITDPITATYDLDTNLSGVVGGDALLIKTHDPAADATALNWLRVNLVGTSYDDVVAGIILAPYDHVNANPDDD